MWEARNENRPSFDARIRGSIRLPEEESGKRGGDYLGDARPMHAVGTIPAPSLMSRVADGKIKYSLDPRSGRPIRPSFGPCSFPRVSQLIPIPRCVPAIRFR